MNATRMVRLGQYLGVFVALGGFVSVLQATPVAPAFSLSPLASLVYSGPQPGVPAMWDVDTLMGNCGVNKESGVGTEFQLKANEVELVWTGSLLDQDLSQPGSPNSLAEASFLGGGTLTLVGKIRDATAAGLVKPVLYDSSLPGNGPLLTATISAFHLQEEDASSDTVSSVGGPITLVPTGGWLYDNSILQLRGSYEFAFVGAMVEPVAGGHLDNFETDLKSLSSFMISLTRVPEPSSILLVAAGLWLVGRRPGRR